MRGEIKHLNDAGKPGFKVAFEYDRGTVERFRQRFPRARWRPEEQAWFVPGTTAEKRVVNFLEMEASRSKRFADEKGRDAFLFEPIDSPYLEGGTDLIVRTPYSPDLVELVRSLPFAQWDLTNRVWRIPYRSFEQLRLIWPEIEERARRAEPAERRIRKLAERGTKKALLASTRASERAKHRHPLLVDDLPALGRPVETSAWGIIAFFDVTGEIVESEQLETHYPDLHALAAGRTYVWGYWRRAGVADLLREWPSRSPPSHEERRRGWWRPMRPQLQDARRKARSYERRSLSREDSTPRHH